MGMWVSGMFEGSSLFSSFGFNHVGVVTTLSACPWVNILETFELELSLGLDWRVLLSHTVVCMDLRIGHSNTNWALALRSLHQLNEQLRLEECSDDEAISLTWCFQLW